MRKCVIIAIAIAVVFPSSAFASSQARDPRVPGLQRQVNSLNQQVAALNARVQHDALVQGCFIATQLNIDVGLLNIWNTFLGEPEDTDHFSDNGACAAIGLPTPRALQGGGGFGVGRLIGQASSLLR
jgi:hypothetical protein